MGPAPETWPVVAEGLMAAAKSDYFSERIRAELAFARSRGARDPEAQAEHLNARGFLTRDGQKWTAEAVEAQTRRPRPPKDEPKAR